MSGTAWSPIRVETDDLVVLSSEHRLYVGRSRDGSYLHVISPSQVDATDGDGNVVRPAGTLECRCKGFTFHGHCYRLEAAIEHEARLADAQDMPVWAADVAPETELEKAAARG